MIRVELRFKNAILYNAIQEQFRSIGEQMRTGSIAPTFTIAAQEMGVCYGTLHKLLTLKEYPRRRKTGAWTPTAIKIAGYLGFTPDDLFPYEIYAARLPRVAAFDYEPRMLGLESANRLLAEPNLSQGLEDEERAAAIAKVLRTISPREEKIVKMRFGFEDGTEHTLDEVGLYFGVSGQRIRQIEAKALRKLRHPSRSADLREWLRH